MELLFVDTSAFFALAHREDRHHREAVAFVRRSERSGARPFTSNFVVAETQPLILARRGHAAARKWLRRFAIPVEQATADDQLRAIATVLEHEDKSYSLTDAISFAMMRRLGTSRAFAFDRHFARRGFAVERAATNQP